MSSPRCPHFRTRAAGFLALAAGYAGLVLFSCSSDPIGTLGSDSDLLGSRPGVVSQDTISVSSDATYAFDTPIAVDTDLELGREDGYERIVILQPGFKALTATDAQRVVESAFLRLVPGNVPGSFPMRIYKLGKTYTEGDPIASLDALTDADAIVDPGTGSIERTVESNEALYELPDSLVQDWIRDAGKREALAMIYTDTVNDRVATFPSRNAADDNPTLQVTYVGGIQRSYAISHDATSYRPTGAPASNLVVSDGYPRRVYLRAELDSLASDAAVHTARMRFHIVPGTLLGVTTTVLLYIPDSTDPSKAEFKTGQRITEKTIFDGDEVLEFSLTNALFLVKQGKLKDNGFAIRFKDENTELRQVELYGSGAADSLRPRVFVTTSAPAVFD